MGKQYLNGVLYGTGEIIKFSPYIYSLEEREIGVWADGKPLYEKTVHVGSITRNTTKTVTCDVGAEKMVHLIGYAYSSYYHQWYSLPYYHWQSRYCVNFLYLDNNNSNGPAVSITAGSELDLDDCYVTLQYTKTTDTPGSGHYTTKGGEAHHYSTSEQVIGTWIDGKPLYEKTIDCGALPNNTSKLVEHNINNIDCIANVFGTSQNTTTKGTLPLSYAHRSQISSQVQMDVTSTYVVLYTAKDNTSYNKTYITIQYTKSTD